MPRTSTSTKRRTTGRKKAGGRQPSVKRKPVVKRKPSSSSGATTRVLVNRKEARALKKKVSSFGVVVKGQPHGLISVNKAELSQLRATSGRRGLSVSYRGRKYLAFPPVRNHTNLIKILRGLQTGIEGMKRKAGGAENMDEALRLLRNAELSVEALKTTTTTTVDDDASVEYMEDDDAEDRYTHENVRADRVMATEELQLARDEIRRRIARDPVWRSVMDADRSGRSRVALSNGVAHLDSYQSLIDPPAIPNLDTHNPAQETEDFHEAFYE